MRKQDGRLVNILAYCPFCKKNVTVKSPGSLYWRGWEDTCEVCGSHGGVIVNFNCPKCSKAIEIELNSW